MNIGMNIKNRREKLGITQKQMAENLSLAQPMIAQIERGTKIPNMILGLAIARMLGCTMEDLVEDVNDLFYEMEGRQIQKMNKVLADVELTKAEEKTLIWLAGWEESTVDHLLSVIEKTARIRADKKGGYAHKSKCESEK